MDWFLIFILFSNVKLNWLTKYMDYKLEDYRAKKRRQATINNVKDKLLKMVSFKGKNSDAENEHVTTEEVSTHYFGYA